MAAAVVVLAIYFAGDGIGHIMQWSAHQNTAPENIWAIPSDFVQPALGSCSSSCTGGRAPPLLRRSASSAGQDRPALTAAQPPDRPRPRRTGPGQR